MRHLFWLFLCLAFCLPVMAVQPIPGLPATVNGGKPVTIVIDRFYPKTKIRNVSDKAEAAIRKAFQTRYPNVALQPFTFSTKARITRGESFIDTNIRESMAEGKAPDVLTVNFRQTGTYIRKGYIRPLDEYISQWRQTPAGEKEFDYFYSPPILKDVCFQSGPDGNMHWYTLPPHLRMVVVLSRLKDKLRAAGVDAEHPPKDWNEFYDQCLKVCDPRPQKDIYAYSLNDCWFLTHMLWSAGSEIVGEKAGKLALLYNDDAAVRAFQFAWVLQRGPWTICADCGTHFSLLPKTLHFAVPTLALPDRNDPGNRVYDLSDINLPLDRHLSYTCPRCHRKGTVGQLRDKRMYFEGVCSDDVDNKYWNDKIIFRISYLGETTLYMGTLYPAKIGLSRMPTDPVTHQSRSEINSTLYAINGTSTNPAIIAAAWAYIRFRTSDEAERILTKVYVENGCASYLNPAMVRRCGYDASSRAVPSDLLSMLNGALQDGRPEPYAPDMQQLFNEMDKAWLAIRDLKSPDPAAIKKILDSNVEQVSAQLLTPPPRQHNRRYYLAVTLGGIGLILVLLASAFVVKRRVKSGDEAG